MNCEYFIKLLLLGDTGVGKSSLMYRYADGEFLKDLVGTAGVDHKIKNIEHRGKGVKIEIWDTAGQERYRELALSYYKLAAGIVLVYDVTDPKSFENISYWLGKIQANGELDTEIILLGNKIDMMNDKQVDQEDAEKLANDNGIPYFEISAKDATNLD